LAFQNDTLICSDFAAVLGGGILVLVSWLSHRGVFGNRILCHHEWNAQLHDDVRLLVPFN
jgi:hypothetical protein